MQLSKFKKKIPPNIFDILKKRVKELRPAQSKSINKGLFKGKNLLVCTPTASGKTLVGELAILNSLMNKKLKAVYVVPLRALASEKYKEFGKRYDFRVGLSSGDMDSSDKHLAYCDIIITTSEKLDSLIRHKASWLKEVGVLVVDEIHLMNDSSRGPTLEIIITLMKSIIPNLQIVALSATIGNPEELAEWLDASLVVDSWRPVRLDQGVYLGGEIEFND